MKKMILLAMTLSAGLTFVSCDTPGSIAWSYYYCAKDTLEAGDPEAAQHFLEKISLTSDSILNLKKDSLMQEINELLNIRSGGNDIFPAHEFQQISKFLEDVYSKDSPYDIFDEQWVKKYCTPKMQQRLIEEYDYDLEPGEVAYASWIIGGWGEGDEAVTTLEAIDRADDGWYEVKMTDVNNPDRGLRILRLSMQLKDGVPQIDEVKKVSDFKPL